MCNRSLFEHYSEQNTSYYGIEYDARNLFVGNAENSRNACLTFMNRHYERGKKEPLLDNDLYAKYKLNGKHIHSVSLYLLGIALLPLFKEKLDKNLKKFIPNYTKWKKSDKDSLYIWFLPAMYHDFASCAELGTILENDSNSHRSLRFHLGNHNIQYSPYRHFPYQKENIPFRFSQELIENYFYYRACKGKCEHGIIAGYLFFDGFIKNFLKNTRNGIDKCSSETRYKLNWNIGHLAFAAYAADAIICHNIWLGDEEKQNEYKRFGLMPLLYNEHPENKLSVEKYPLQFMLCMLDTIEPIKRFKSALSPCEILQSIKLDYDKNQNEWLAISWCDEIAQQKEFKDWHGGIIKMQDWMCVNVEEKENRIIITFK